MTIIQLEYLVAVANHGSFSVASEHCFVTQPSLSMQIKNLEEELGVTLLDRSKKPVIPTEAGQVVLTMARQAIQRFRSIKETVNDLRGEVSGVLRLGVIPTVAPYLIHLFMAEFLANFPKVELQIREMLTTEIIHALNRDLLDAAIMTGGTFPGQVMELELFNDRFLAYVSPSNPLYERSNIRIEDIDLKNLYLLSPGHCLRDQVLELLQAQRQIPLACAFEGGSLETLMRIVDSTSGITIVPEMVTDFIPEEHRAQLKTLARGAASRKVILAVRRTYVKQSLIAALRASILSVRS